MANANLGFQGAIKRGSFNLEHAATLVLLQTAGNPNGRPNSDVVFPYVNGLDVTRRNRSVWIVDFGNRLQTDAAGYEQPFRKIEKVVKPERAKTNQAKARDEWWLHWCPRPEMNAALDTIPRFLVTPRVAKHRIFAWMTAPCYKDCQLITFAFADDYFFGVLHSRLHELWALAQGTQLREKESGFRYTPTTCFETFPFPAVGRVPDAASAIARSGTGPTTVRGAVAPHVAAIAAAAKELNELRERWLNPPEWTVEKILEFPGSVGGPWDRYLDKSTIREVGRGLRTAPPSARSESEPYLVGTVRYPRLEPRDTDCAAKLKRRTLTNLYNERPAWLDLAHKKLDAAVAAAYGWPDDLTDEEILSRLLALNLERAKAEQLTGKKKTVMLREKRDDEML